MEKLRNKNAGFIVKFLSLELVDDDEIEFTYVMPSGHEKAWSYSSLEEFKEEWEIYKPVEPLIEDSKTRKVFREWADLIGAERFRVGHLCKYGRTIITSTDLISKPVIVLPGYIGEDSETYTREELCGEDEE